MIDDIVTELLPYAEAVQRVKRLAVGRKVFVHANQSARMIENPAHVYNVGGCIKVTKSEALRYMDSAFYATIRDKVLVGVAHSDRCLFVG